MSSPLFAVVLAAGQGKRMKSDLPKVLHKLAAKPLLDYVVNAARQLSPERIFVVYGHGGETVPQALAHLDVEWRLQAEQLGTGHAVGQAMGDIPDDACVLVLYGDVPLVDPVALAAITRQARAGSVGLLTVELDEPAGYGRVLRADDGAVTGIVEHKDANPAQLAVREINTGIMAVPSATLRAWLGRLRADNSQREYYLTDIIAMAVADGVSVRTVHPATLEEVLGVNDRVQLAQLERFHQRREAERLMRDGATMADPSRVDVRGEVRVGRDVFIDVNVVLEGRVELADRVRVGPNVLIRDSRIGQGSEILANSVVEEAEVGAGSRVGPFSRLRPGAVLASGVHVGNFVEIKNANVGAGSKVNHLSYVGDADIGGDVNVGAGTITCNYDGANKHRTVVGDGVFIGSGVELVAPVVIGAGATIGAGSTISRQAPAGQLTLSRSRQTTVPGWKRPTRNKL